MAHALALLWTQTATYLLDIALAGMFLLYFLHNLAMVLLPFVNRPLYDSATIRLRPAVLIVAGTFAIAVMCYFIWTTIPKVSSLFALWIAAGALLFGIGRFLGKQEKFDYEENLHRDWQATDEESSESVQV